MSLESLRPDRSQQLPAGGENRGGRGGLGGRGGRGGPRRMLADPRILRGLAHPIRLELLSIIGRAGRITAADAARELGISHALTSHHLHQLRKYEFARQVDGADRRERPWQIMRTSINVDGIEDEPGGSEALAMFEQVTVERALEELSRWQDRRASWPPGWRQHSGASRNTVYLTEDELAELIGEFEKLVVHYTDRRPIYDVASRPAGSKAVDMTLIVVPHEPVAAER
jgi:DNA-binding transcriptional ArsR family regulator